MLRHLLDLQLTLSLVPETGRKATLKNHDHRYKATHIQTSANASLGVEITLHAYYIKIKIFTFYNNN